MLTCHLFISQPVIFKRKITNPPTQFCTEMNCQPWERGIY